MTCANRFTFVVITFTAFAQVDTLLWGDTAPNQVQTKSDMA